MNSRSEAILEEVLEAIRSGKSRIPTSPEVVAEIELVISDDKKGIPDIVRVIQKSPALVARVLQVVNSPALRRGAQVTHLNDAVVHLGVSLVKNLSLALSIKDRLTSKDPALNKVLVDLWQHSARIGIYCSLFSANLDQKKIDPCTALTIGVVHCLGALLLVNYFEKNPLPPQDMWGIMEDLSPKLTTVLAERWNLPDVIISSLDGRHPVGSFLLDVSHHFGANDREFPTENFLGLSYEAVEGIYRDNLTEAENSITSLL